MSCGRYSLDGPAGIADMLANVDCATRQTTAAAFDRLFGAHGMLSLALTALLTLYVGLLAVNLLTGRSSLSLSLLTPRALTLGLVLTFATSWAAYQAVVWNLAAGAPDQIASLLAGTHGSATHLFADQLDKLFAAISDAAQTGAAPAAETAKKAAPFTPADLLWFSALLLLLSTAGVLIVARIALAALLAIGPVFILLVLFEGTRGLFEGWLKSVSLFAIVPLLTVLVGSGALALLNPMIAALALTGTALSMQTAMSIFLGAGVYAALLLMTLKAATSLTAGWRLPGARQSQPLQTSFRSSSSRDAVAAVPAGNAGLQDERIRQIVAITQARQAAPLAISQTEAAGAFRAPPIPAPQLGSRERVRGLGTSSRRQESAR